MTVEKLLSVLKTVPPDALVHVYKHAYDYTTLEEAHHIRHGYAEITRGGWAMVEPDRKPSINAKYIVIID